LSVLRLYKDSALTSMVSTEGEFSNPDEEASLDGTNGETAISPLWVAVEQSALAADLDDSEQTIQLTGARFANTGYPVIVIGAEKMLITSGFGTTSLTVNRGHNGTTPAAHASGDSVLAAYDCSSVSISCQDNGGTDESGWVDYCDDDGGSPNGVWEAPHSLGNLNCGQSAAIHRRVVVPAGTPAAYKQDLVHRLTATINEIS
jgi:hypothetical protein